YKHKPIPNHRNVQFFCKVKFQAITAPVAMSLAGMSCSPAPTSRCNRAAFHARPPTATVKNLGMRRCHPSPLRLNVQKLCSRKLDVAATQNDTVAASTK